MESGGTSSIDLSIGIGKYRLLAELGRGGMGTVFLAVAEGRAGLRKLVVLKVLAPGLAEEPSAREMFLAEARLAARLNHPNVVQTFEVAREAGRDVIVMEYLEGHPLATILRRARQQHGAPMPMSMQLRIVADALQGLHYAHELTDFDGSPLKIVHRDVSPHNIFVTYDGVAKLLDFGIAKAVTSSSTTGDGTIKGKVPYMSPEQLAGEPLDRRADVFSMGVVLWDIVVGKRLWYGMPDVAIMRELSTKTVPSLRDECPDVDPLLERIVMKALAPEKRDRYPTALELQLDIESYLSWQEVHDTTRSVGQYVADLFQDVRASTRSRIEQGLRSGGVDPASALSASVPPPAIDDLEAMGRCGLS
jgi:serine/threonine-protein kinase